MVSIVPSPPVDGPRRDRDAVRVARREVQRVGRTRRHTRPARDRDRERIGHGRDGNRRRAERLERATGPLGAHVPVVEGPVELHRRGRRIARVGVGDLAQDGVDVGRGRDLAVRVGEYDHELARSGRRVEGRDLLAVLDELAADERDSPAVVEVEQILRGGAAVADDREARAGVVADTTVQRVQLFVTDVHVRVEYHGRAALGEGGRAVEGVDQREVDIEVPIAVVAQHRQVEVAEDVGVAGDGDLPVGLDGQVVGDVDVGGDIGQHVARAAAEAGVEHTRKRRSGRPRSSGRSRSWPDRQ